MYILSELYECGRRRRSVPLQHWHVYHRNPGNDFHILLILYRLTSLRTLIKINSIAPDSLSTLPWRWWYMYRAIQRHCGYLKSRGISIHTCTYKYFDSDGTGVTCTYPCTWSSMPVSLMYMCFALFVCLTLLASFFHLSFKNMYVLGPTS